ncbi:MAG: hypothetical protein C5B50_14725 [Verrucomicrobia bacterium]|nr:MAG: hypothetical protein C5B50_14725 [Verrucomicrobiota bacterium]
MQSLGMESNAAAEHIQVIRTLMERAAVYRRALAPVMIFNGVLGILAGAFGWLMRLEPPRVFIGYWMVVALIGASGSFLLIRRQSLKAAEPFWSPPTRRVAQALLPALVFGFALGLVLIIRAGPHQLRIDLTSSSFVDINLGNPADELVKVLSLDWLPLAWIGLYGCAIHAAGFFMPRGMKLFGLAFVLGASSFLVLGLPDALAASRLARIHFGHGVMGFFFGLGHLAYGIYLYFTEPRRNEM